MCGSRTTQADHDQKADESRHFFRGNLDQKEFRDIIAIGSCHAACLCNKKSVASSHE